jgi:hypothetical protein
MAALPEYQGGLSRHRCAVCSYASGLAGTALGTPTATCKHGHVAPESVIAALPERSQAGEARHKCVICAYAAGFADRERTAGSLPDEIVDDAYPEGARKTVTINAFERNSEARRRCLAHYGYRCSVCGLKLEDRYGEAGKELIHVHHLRPLAQIAGPYDLDPISDLRPVCPNCHAVIHRANPPYALDDVRAMLR